MNKLKPYLKTVVAGIVTIGYAVQAALSDDVVNGEEVGAIIALVLTTLGVFTVKNQPAEPDTSTIVRSRAF